MRVDFRGRLEWERVKQPGFTPTEGTRRLARLAWILVARNQSPGRFSKASQGAKGPSRSCFEAEECSDPPPKVNRSHSSNKRISLTSPHMAKKRTALRIDKRVQVYVGSLVRFDVVSPRQTMPAHLPQNSRTSTSRSRITASSSTQDAQDDQKRGQGSENGGLSGLDVRESRLGIATEAGAGYPNCGFLPSDSASHEPTARARSTQRGGDPSQLVNTTPLLLIADHRGEGLEHHLEALALEGFRCRISTNLRSTLTAIDHEIPALIIIDPLARKGTEELRSLDEARTGNPPIPLLVLTYAERRADLIESLAAMNNGLWDLTERRAPREEVTMRVERLLNEASLHSEMRDLRHRASHDDRTDLLRVNAFQQRLGEHFSAAQRHHFEMALVLIDLDNFGAINKRHDHTVGDILISQAGEIIRRTLRTEDIAGRIGGDEFAVVLPYTHKVDTARVVNRLVEEIHKLSGRPKGAKEDIVVAASVGFETFNGRDIATLEEMRTHAERALRAAKVAGGNRGIYFRQLGSVEEESGQA